MLRLFSVLSALCLLLPIASAQAPKKEAAATVSGSITLNGSPMRNVVVSLQIQNQPAPQQSQRATTDADGRFRFTDVAAGQYLLSALTPGFYSASDYMNGMPGKVLNVATGETIENLELQLKRGAVITGRVIDENNEPIAEMPVQLARVGDRMRLPQNVLNFSANNTDDRGIYRIFGLPPGKYQVSVGVPLKDGNSNSFVRTRTFVEQTFHPDTTDQTKAKVIELEEGQEASDVDIRIGKMISAYEVSGRVIDSQTGQPVAGTFVGFGQVRSPTGEVGGWTTTGPRTDTNGEFHMSGLRSGKYGIFLRSSSERDEYYSNPVMVEITNRDLSGIEIRAQRGATITGWAIIEGTNDPAIQAKRSQIRLSTTGDQNSAAPSFAISTQVKPDGSFRLAGVPAGKTRLRNFENTVGLSLVRIEQNGVPVKDDTLQIRAGEQINNVRVIFAHSTAAIRGRVIFVGGELPEGIQLMAYAKQYTANATDKYSPVDARGYFVIEGLMPGEYQVRLSANYTAANTAEINNAVRRLTGSTQRIVVTSNNQVQATFTIDLTPEGKKQ